MSIKSRKSGNQKVGKAGKQEIWNREIRRSGKLSNQEIKKSAHLEIKRSKK
jgi:hypothetical protein